MCPDEWEEIFRLKLAAGNATVTELNVILRRINGRLDLNVQFSWGEVYWPEPRQPWSLGLEIKFLPVEIIIKSQIFTALALVEMKATPRKNLSLDQIEAPYPSMCGAMPRRVVSTLGNSGMIRRRLGKPACRRLGEHGFEIFVAQPRGRAVIQIVHVVEAVVGAEGVGFAVDAEGDGARRRGLDSGKRLRAVASCENIALPILAVDAALDAGGCGS